MIQHLTDEQFANLMAGEVCGTDVQLHLDSCEICRCELASVGTAVNDLSSISMRWAEQRASRIQAPSIWTLNWKTLPGWSATMAAVLIFSVAMGAHMRSATQAAAIEPAQSMTSPTADEVAQDNRLMRSINEEINEQPGAQMAASALRDSSRSTHRRLLREVAN